MDEDGFTVVKSRGNWAVKRLLGTSRRAIENWKGIEPPDSFTVVAGEGKVVERKEELWADLVRKVGTPKINKTWVNGEGNIRLMPGDKRTAEALKEMGQEGKIEMREVGKEWPKVLIYNVEREIDREEIDGAIKDLKPELGLGGGENSKDIVPIFKRGPKDGNYVWWVCAVRPGVYGKLVDRYVYVGMSRCRVKGYVDFVQ